MADYLAKNNEIIYIDENKSPIDYFYKIFSFLLVKLGKSSDFKRHKLFVRLACKRIQRKLDNEDYDLIFAPGSTYITYIKSTKPIAIWVDATFQSLIGFYPQYSNLPNYQVRNGNELESTAFANCKHIICTTKWAGKSAIIDYGVDENKVSIVPLGANLTHCNSLEDIRIFNSAKSNEKIKLLFVGVDWEKKGGDLLLEIFRYLIKISNKYELNIVGSQPSIIPEIKNVTFHGFLRKSNKEEAQKLENLYKNSHYFILPTKAEAFGIVFCEANSYGLPAFGSDLGGIPDIIENNVNGQLIDITKNAEELANKIHNYINSGDYSEKSINSFLHYKNNFTWDNSIRKVNEILDKLI